MQRLVYFNITPPADVLMLCWAAAGGKSSKILSQQLFGCVVLTNTWIIIERNGKSAEWLSEVKYVGVLMLESCCCGSNKLSAPFMRGSLLNQTISGRQVPYRENQKGCPLPAHQSQSNLMSHLDLKYLNKKQKVLHKACRNA